MVTIDLCKIAIESKNVTHFKPIVKRLAQLRKRFSDQVTGKIPLGTRAENEPFDIEETELRHKFYELGLKHAKHKEVLDDFDIRETTAFFDLIDAIEEIVPESHDVLHKLGSALVTASDIKKYYPMLEKLLASLDLDKIIAEDTEFGRKLPASSYKSALAKYRKILKYCAEHGYALLNIAVGD